MPARCVWIVDECVLFGCILHVLLTCLSGVMFVPLLPVLCAGGPSVPFISLCQVLCARLAYLLGMPSCPFVQCAVRLPARWAVCSIVSCAHLPAWYAILSLHSMCCFPACLVGCLFHRFVCFSLACRRCCLCLCFVHDVLIGLPGGCLFRLGGVLPACFMSVYCRRVMAPAAPLSAQGAVCSASGAAGLHALWCALCC